MSQFNVVYGLVYFIVRAQVCVQTWIQRPSSPLTQQEPELASLAITNATHPDQAQGETDLEVETIDFRDPCAERLPNSEEVAFLKQRLDEEIRHRWRAEALILKGPAAARLTGRIARIELIQEDAKWGTLWLAVPEEDGGHQAIRLHFAVGDLVRVTEGNKVTIEATWHHGRLSLVEVESVEQVDDPMPEVRLPDKAKDIPKHDGQLPTMAELDKQAREGGWGALNHSVYRFQVPVHITFSPKYRAKLFDGKATEVQAICREVAEAEGLNVIALAAEVDHLHLLGMPAGTGGMPPTWQWSRWVGRFKALTSKRLKVLPGLEDFQWQTGYAITAVHGGHQGAEAALEIVKRYVTSQGIQDDQEAGVQASDEESEGAA